METKDIMEAIDRIEEKMAATSPPPDTAWYVS